MLRYDLRLMDIFALIDESSPSRYASVGACLRLRKCSHILLGSKMPRLQLLDSYCYAMHHVSVIPKIQLWTLVNSESE